MANPKITTPIALGSYVTVFEPKAFEGQDPKFSISLLWPKADKEAMVGLAELKRAVVEVAVKKFGPEAAGWLKKDAPKNKKLDSPFRDGDIEKPEDAIYSGKVYVTAKSMANRKPQVVDGRRNPVFDEADCYSGCFFRAIVQPYAYDKAGNRGVALGLLALQVVRKGERLDGGIDASKAFDDCVFEEEEEPAAAATGTDDLLD